MQVSCRFFPHPSADITPVVRLLELRGVHSGVLSDNGLPAVVVFATADEELIAALEDCRDRDVRSLAVCVARTRPAPSLTWKLIAAGASDVYWWDGGRDPGAEVHARLERWQTVDSALRSDLVRSHMVGEGRAWVAVLRELIEVAMFGTGPCLLEGESGTGKELAARLVHTLDPRPNKKELIIVDCSTLVPELSGSEFFGHERGAFTGAAGSRDGAFALADGGTLFLDETGELPLTLQAQLLRLIQEGAYKRVGGNEWRHTEFRLVCATNRDLRADVEAGRFRADLYYRLAGAVVRMPPLRERRSDILPVARHFVAGLLPDCPDIDPAVAVWLSERDYPGNLRELRQVVTRMCRRHAGRGPLSPGDLAPEDRPAAGDRLDWRAEPLEEAVSRALRDGATLKDIGREALDCAIRLAIEASGGSLHAAARSLGVTDRALQIRRAAQRENGPGKASRRRSAS